MTKYQVPLLFLASLLPVWVYAIEPIQHDIEHYLLLEQYADRSAAEDDSIDKVLADKKGNSNGEPPNIIYILIEMMLASASSGCPY